MDHFAPVGLEPSPHALPATRPDNSRPDIDQERQQAAHVAAPLPVPAAARGYEDEALRLARSAVNDVSAIRQKGPADPAQLSQAQRIVENSDGDMEKLVRELASKIKLPQNTPAPTPHTMQQVRKAVQKTTRASKLARAADLGRPKSFAQEQAAKKTGRKMDAANNCMKHMVKLMDHYDSELAYYNEKVMKIDKAYSKVSELRGIIRKYESHAAIDFNKPKDEAQGAEFAYVKQLAKEAEQYGFRWALDGEGKKICGWQDVQGKDSLDKGLEQAGMAVTTIGKKYPHFLQHIMGMLLLAAQMIATVVQMLHKLLIGFIDRMGPR